MAVYFVGGAKLIKDIKSINAEIEILRSMEFGGVGRIEKYAASTPPQNTIKANGATLSRTTFARLWEYAQASGNLVDQASKDLGNFGTGDGSTTFTIPDHRGVAGRGFDDGAGLDSMPTLGRYQPDEIKAHNHTVKSSPNDNSPRNSLDTARSGSFGNASWIGTTGGEENTMKNVSFLYCIRYQ